MRYASLCDGIGAVHCAWQPLGWECAWTSEIDKFPVAVVDLRWGFRNLGDMTEITGDTIDEHGRLDLLVGGTPCQSFSVAGLRGGLDDARGNLALRFMQLCAAARPRWVVWENVPGVLSVDGGRAFGSILGALEELGYGWAYRTLDAQWFGVAQRRRRVFVVGHSGDWRRAAAVLFERESVRGDPPTREAPREAAASIAGRGAAGASWWDGGQLSQTLDAVLSKGQTMPEKNRFPAVLEPVAFSHSADGGSNGIAWTPDGSPPLRGGGGGNSMPAVLVAHTSDGVVADPITTTEGKSWTNEGNMFRLRNCVQQPVMAFKPGQSEAAGATFVTEEFIPTLQSQNNGSTAVPAVSCRMAVRRLTPRECERLQGFQDDYTLIPWRKKPAEDCPDGPRYRALGNSMAVPVMRWIGERIEAVDRIPNTGEPDAGQDR